MHAKSEPSVDQLGRQFRPVNIYFKYSGGWEEEPILHLGQTACMYWGETIHALQGTGLCRPSPSAAIMPAHV